MTLDANLVTAGGNILCRRCQARSSRTKEQCGRAALRGKRVCQFHGGRNTGPKTEAGKARLRTLNLKDGLFTRERVLASSRFSLRLRYLEDIAIHLGMFSTRTPGRKPRGYVKLDLGTDAGLRKALRLAQDSPITEPSPADPKSIIHD